MGRVSFGFCSVELRRTEGNYSRSRSQIFVSTTNVFSKCRMLWQFLVSLFSTPEEETDSSRVKQGHCMYICTISCVQHHCYAFCAAWFRKYFTLKFRVCKMCWFIFQKSLVLTTSVLNCSTTSNIVKYDVKCNLFLWCKAESFAS